jgi:hypothetical protein
MNGVYAVEDETPYIPLGESPSSQKELQYLMENDSTNPNQITDPSVYARTHGVVRRMSVDRIKDADLFFDLTSDEGINKVIENEVEVLQTIDQNNFNPAETAITEETVYPLFNGNAWDSYRVGDVLKGGCVANTLQDHRDRESFQGTLASEYARRCIAKYHEEKKDQMGNDLGEDNPFNLAYEADFDGQKPANWPHPCGENHPLMREILEEKISQGNSPGVNSNTDAIMHLRLGDVSETICQTKCVLNKLFLDKEAVKYWWQNDETKELVFDLKDQREGDNLWRKSDYLMSLKFYENTIPTLRANGVTKVTIVSGSHYAWDMKFQNSSYFIRTV